MTAANPIMPAANTTMTTADTAMTTADTAMTYQRLNVTLDGKVAVIELARPGKANALDLPMWQELRHAMRWLDATPAARVGILRGAGALFTSGIDLALLAGLPERIADPCEGRAREKLRGVILDLQDTLTAIDRCRKPVIAAVHGPCIGGGVDIVLACDMRYCSADAVFSVKEVAVGLTADLGTLQRLPRLIGEGMARELAYTGRNVDGREARELGLVNRCYDTPADLAAGVGALAAEIAAKSPLAVRGCKEMITYARDHSLADGLNYVATWNAAMLLSADLPEALAAARERRAPNHRD
jgi:enoyl-CoA hydratase